MPPFGVSSEVKASRLGVPLGKGVVRWAPKGGGVLQGPS